MVKLDDILKIAISFIKMHRTGSFRGTNCWMYENLDILGKRTLKDLCITGSHDRYSNININLTFF